MSLLLIFCQVPQVEATDIIQRLNYGVVFKQEAQLYISEEYWLHTFQMSLPQNQVIPRIRRCHKDNNTCLMISQILSQINTIRTETALRLNNTVKMIHRLIPTTSITKSRSERALLPFLGQFSKTIFGTATTDDVDILARHINALNKRTSELSKALDQHGAHFSSYIT